MSGDPFLEREKEKYEHPIPSREFILDTLEQLGHPVTKKKLESLFQIQNTQAAQALSYRLKAMIRDAQLMLDRRGRYCLLERLTVVCGKIIGHREGFGFLIPEDGSDDLFIPPQEMRSVMHGDRVLARKAGKDYRGRETGIIHEVLERRNRTVVGKIFKEHNLYFLEPDSKHLPNAIYLPKEMLPSTITESDEHAEQMVLVEIMDFPTKRVQAVGRVVEILGDSMAPGMEINVAIHAHNLPTDWSEDTKAFIATMRDKVTVDKEMLRERKDLRHLSFVTIDGEDAKDFDDAVYAEPVKRSKGSWRLFVAIADVSHYVKPGTILDEEAYLRGNSVYFPGRVIPMLPEILSNELCSLKPKVDRLCFVCEMVIAADGTLKKYQFYRGIMHSKARITYTQASDVLTKQKEHECKKELENLFSVYHLLLGAREERGALDFETTETRIIFDEHKKIERICLSERTIAHRLIEECMLVANVATARFLKKEKIPTLFRVHAEPSPEKMKNLREFLEEMSVAFTGSKKITTQHYCKVLERIATRPDKHLIQTVLLRSMSQAQYSEKNTGHFGLAYPAYTHFTSPIRRYPDLLVHRAIGWIVDNQIISEYPYTEKQMKILGQHCSDTERRADEATREVVAWLKCEYLQDKLGQEFNGRISAVTGFGIFVELDDVYVDGLVHVTGLQNDYYRFDAAKHRLIGEHSRVTYRLGDRVRVRVSRVNLDDRKIDLDLITE
jgi:ribonuclease R